MPESKLLKEVEPIYVELSAKMGLGQSVYMPRIIAKLANLDQARILKELPKSPEELAAQLNLSKAEVENHLQELYEKGVVFPTKKGYQMARNMVQLHDASAASGPKWDKALDQEFFALWSAFLKEDLETRKKEASSSKEVKNTTPIFRIIPRWKSIKDIPNLLPYEDFRQILKDNIDEIALVRCSCKRVKYDRECGLPDETCINVARTAGYNIARGAGRRISYDEAMAIAEKLEQHKAPVVHLVVNTKEVRQLICNCHWDCCGALDSFLKEREAGIPLSIAKSRFEAEVEKAACRGCKTCLKRCQFGAISMKHDPASGKDASYTDPEKCMGCGVCVISCPSKARHMKLARPPEHVCNPESTIY